MSVEICGWMVKGQTTKGKTDRGREVSQIRMWTESREDGVQDWETSKVSLMSNWGDAKVMAF